ncbi:Na-translocating system protein MpsC family protein [Planococcus sp. CAU13]|uniref:Na-translocating system protein MpsC family protein n=1 Tax=Planococcus sp. CAU13 TaxID=1541197 RepID=UPI00053008B3|nr:Na-translocating system protein MpsC family protein [Planococcus sp. CAU13]
MTGDQAIHSQISAYAADFLKEHFNEAPSETVVFFKAPFLLIHFKGFLLAPERLLVGQGESTRVLESRDLLLNALKEDFLEGLQPVVKMQLNDLFFDWNLEKQTGLLLAVAENEIAEDNFPPPGEIDAAPIKEIIQMNSALSQKKPERTELFWLGPSILLVKRKGILVDIEKELLKNGAAEELRLAKRPLEYRLTKLFNLDSFLPVPVEEIFVDWNFGRDMSYMVLLLERQMP